MPRHWPHGQPKPDGRKRPSRDSQLGRRTELRKHAPSYDRLVPILNKHTPGGYSKTGLDFRHYEDGWREAVRRARQLAPDGKELEVNPSTGMWKLALAIGGPQ